MKLGLITGNGWIGDDGKTWSDFVVYVRLKDCKDVAGFDAILKQHDLLRVSDAYECTMKHRLGFHPEYSDGHGYWEVCDPAERGACKMMFAAFIHGDVISFSPPCKAFSDQHPETAVKNGDAAVTGDQHA